VIRRIGADKEVFVRVDLERIFEGRQPDVFLKANDVVQVGTDWVSAIFGGYSRCFPGSRMAFGFLYDRTTASAEAAF